MSGEPEVLCRIEGRVGRIILNRPGALHALTTSMCRLMTESLLAWRDDPDVALVMFDHSGERGFCAGGDIRMLADSGAGDGREAREF
ncbi:MAG: enoyl-CoA hydratase/isomerase family protein, partial [Alphaproteobacteria bacterium]